MPTNSRYPHMQFASNISWMQRLAMSGMLFRFLIHSFYQFGVDTVTDTLHSTSEARQIGQNLTCQYCHCRNRQSRADTRHKIENWLKSSTSAQLALNIRTQFQVSGYGRCNDSRGVLRVVVIEPSHHGDALSSPRTNGDSLATQAGDWKPMHLFELISDVKNPLTINGSAWHSIEFHLFYDSTTTQLNDSRLSSIMVSTFTAPMWC